MDNAQLNGCVGVPLVLSDIDQRPAYLKPDCE